MAQSLRELDEQVRSAYEAELVAPGAASDRMRGHARASDRTPHESGLVRAWRGLKPGDLVAGKYRVERLLERTGLLCAAQVRHLVLETQGTIKYLLPESRAFPEMIANFLRGARLLSQLRSEHIASVMDVGMLELGTPYLVLEQPDGPDFSQVIRVRGGLPIDESVVYIKQICEGLAQAHALGLIHGGLRPANTVLTRRRDGLPIACVTDFGNSDAFDFGDLTRTEDGLRTAKEVLDVVRYLAPDHARFPESLDARADVWAIGAIFHELLAGVPAYEGRSPAGLLAAIAADAPTPLSSLRSDVPEAIAAIVERCLDKDRENRFANASQLLRALEANEDWADVSRPTQSSSPTQMATSRDSGVRDAGGLDREPRGATSSLPPPLPFNVAVPQAAHASSLHAVAASANHLQPRQSSPALAWGGIAAVVVGLLVGGAALLALNSREAPRAPVPEALQSEPVEHYRPVDLAAPVDLAVRAPSEPDQPVGSEAVAVPATLDSAEKSANSAEANLAVHSFDSLPAAPPVAPAVQAPAKRSAPSSAPSTKSEAHPTVLAGNKSAEPAREKKPAAPASADDPFGSF